MKPDDDEKRRKALAVRPATPVYEVGYGKPPATPAFKQGPVGQSKGRPKGAKGRRRPAPTTSG